MTISEQIKQLLASNVRFSDIHIAQGRPLRVRAANGLLEKVTEHSTEAQEIEFFLGKHLRLEHGKKWEDRLQEAGGQLDFPATVESVRFRCNLQWFDGRQLGVVMRKINTVIPELRELGLPESVRNLTDTTKGLLLITGETGSGKSTTLASLVQEINRRSAVHIITIEDPIEYVFKEEQAKIMQRAVGEDADTASFEKALRTVLRQDPDVIVIGELRDYETADIALKAAETGHFVLATLHTVNAQSSINRLLSMFPSETRDQARETLASTLIGVVSQCLLSRKDGTGSVLGYEIMLNTAAPKAGIPSLIREGKLQQLNNTIQQGTQMGMTLLNARLKSLVESQVISREEALRHAYDKDALLF